MVLLLIGAIAGFVLSFTGTGGAVVSVPLLERWAHLPVKEATVYSLLVVSFGAWNGWCLQRKNTHYRVSIAVTLGASITSYLSRPLKSHLSEETIRTLFCLTCALSLGVLIYSVLNRAAHEKLVRVRGKKSIFPILLFTPFMGLLITLTGLGGGILFLPFLQVGLRFPLHEAAATSLLAVAASSTFSFLVQTFSPDLGFIQFNSVACLGLGVLVSAIPMRALFRRLSAQQIEPWRKAGLALALMGSIAGMLLR